jgi:hypothetical protein
MSNAALANDYFDAVPPTAVFSRQQLMARYRHSNVASELSNPPTPKWLDEAKNQLEELSKLANGWDSYGGKQITATALSFARQLLLQLVTPGMPRPSLVPTSDGSVQIEWHTKGIDLEILVLSSTRVGVSFDDLQGEHEPVDVELQYDFRELNRMIEVLSQR